MKKVKFRVWDYENKRWFPREYVQDEWVNLLPDGELVHGIECCPEEPNEGRFEAVLFSDQLDKNGKEIYQGDKLKFIANPYSRIGIVCLGEYEQESQHAHDINSFHYGWYIEFDYREFGSTRKKKLSLFAVLNTPKGYGMSTHQGEVIGNIYENLDLLK